MDQRRDGVARSRARRRLRVLAVLAAGSLVAVGGWQLLESRWMSARVVRVEGAVHSTPAAVIAAAGLGAHPPLVSLDPGAMASRIEDLPWVASARVVRNWPDGVTVTVAEWAPVAAVALPQGGWAEVAHNGKVLADVAQPGALVQLGLPSPPGRPGTVLPPADRSGLAVVATEPRALSSLLQGVTVRSSSQVDLVLAGPLTVHLGAPTDLAAKYEDIAALVASGRLHAGDVVDVSAPGAPTVATG